MMKKISVFLALALTIGCMPEKKNSVLSGKVSESPDDKLTINLPIDGKFFAGNNQEINLESNGTYNTEIPSETTGLVSLFSHFTPAYLFSDNQETFTVDFQGENVTYDSKNEKISQLFSELELFANVRSTVDAEKHLDLESKIKYYSELLQSRKKTLDKARKDLQLSNKGYEKLKNMLELKVADLQSADFFFTFRLFYEKTPEKRSEFVTTYLKSWEELHQKAFNNPDFSAYGGQVAFISRHKMLQDIKKTGNLQFGSGEKPYFISEIDFIRTNLPKNLIEFAWANAMYEGIMQGKFEKDWITNFEEFKSQYPESKIIIPLSSYVDKIVEYHKEDKSFVADFVEGYENINTLDELFSKYEGKVLYVDIWATWCVPCRKELQFSKENHHILEEMGVVPIYLSIDQNNADEQWKSMVKNLKLSGVHIRANDKLKEELGEFVNAIPYYIIVDKKGKIHVKPAKRPSDKQELFNQLKTYL